MANLLDGFKKNSDKDRLSRVMEIAKEEKPAGDDAVWAPKLNEEAGQSAFLIRFLYNPNKNDGRFYESIRSHTFKSAVSNLWYFENCPKTHGWDKECPACDKVNAMKAGRQWNDIPSNEQNAIRKYFANQYYWANVYVIKDPENPENEGQVKKFRFGKKILAKIQEALKDDPITGTSGFSAFDPLNGANFKLVIKKVGGFNNYDDSQFLPPSPFLNGDEAAIEDILENRLYDLSDKTVCQDINILIERFDAVEGNKKKPVKRKPVEDFDDGYAGPEEDDDVPLELPKKTKKAKEPAEGDDDGDIDDNYFAQLVQDI